MEIKYLSNIEKKKYILLHVSTEIANIHAHKVISDAFFNFQIP